MGVLGCDKTSGEQCSARSHTGPRTATLIKQQGPLWRPCIITVNKEHYIQFRKLNLFHHESTNKNIFPDTQDLFGWAAFLRNRMTDTVTQEHKQMFNELSIFTALTNEKNSYIRQKLGDLIIFVVFLENMNFRDRTLLLFHNFFLVVEKKVHLFFAIILLIFAVI